MKNIDSIKVNIRAELLAEYEGYATIAIFMNGKMSRVLTVKLDDE